MKRIPVLPTLITLGNAFCGFLSISYAMKAMVAQGDPALFNKYMQLAGWLIFCAMVFDALDGKVARLANATSNFGAELDSLCDVISFGVAPAVIVMVIAAQQHFLPRLAVAAGLLYMMCAALRLARFNIETEAAEESHWYFKGLPSPAAAAFIAGLTINIFEIYELRDEVRGEHEMAVLAKALAPIMDGLLWVMPFVAIILGLLMISRIRYIHVMNKLLKGQEPLDYLVKLIVVVILAVLTRPFSLALLVGVYVLSGIVIWCKELIYSRLPDDIKHRTTPRE